MEKIIKAAVERGASDLHIKAGDVFRARIDGKLVPLTKQRLTPEQTRAIAVKLLPSPLDKERLDQIKDFDCSWGMPGVGRFRVNVLRQRSSFMIVMRVIPFTVPSIESLKLPAIIGTLAESAQGLIVVAGVTGSGKSSTVAAMLDHINQNLQRHIVTIENPIEYLHRDVKCSVTQREVGVDTGSYAVGLQAALRQDPDVIVTGELADADTLDTAIKAAEIGRLVISTLPAPDVVAAVARLQAMFPGSEREIARIRLSEAFRGILAQRLLPRTEAQGRVAAVELLLPTADTRAAMRVGEDPGTIRRLMSEGSAHGMRTFEQAVTQLKEAGDITPETAEAFRLGAPAPDKAT
jgi:twitching motility protein PilT